MNEKISVNKNIPTQIRSEIAKVLLVRFLPILAFTLVLMLLVTILNDVLIFKGFTVTQSIQRNLSGIVTTMVILGMMLFLKRDSSQLILAYSVFAVIVFGLFVQLSVSGSFRTPVFLIFTSLSIIWAVFFTSFRISLIYLSYVVLLITVTAYLNGAGIIQEHLLPTSLPSVPVAVFGYIILYITLLYPVYLLFDTIRKNGESLEALQESKRFTEQAMDRSRQLFGWTSPDGTLLFANHTSLNMVDVTLDQVVGKKFWETPWFSHDPDEQDRLQDAIREASQGNPVRYHLFHKTKSGQMREIDFQVSPTFDSDGKITMLVVEGIDITDEQNSLRQKEILQEQLHQSQKMEAIGQLAGGVAHDFNNALAGIIGAADMMREEEFPPEVQRDYLDLIITASERAADLTKKLLTFSRKGSKVSTAVNCCKIINDTVGLLRHTINKNITVSVENRSQYGSIIGDDSLLQNAFMNMGINASHAMPDGGELVFTLENVSLDAEYCATSPFDLNPGEYLEISVRDTGTGMPPEIVSRIFEPFFTTKEEGKGTGLGMAAVYGTVQEHGGAITVYSEVGVGTVFHIYLPVSDEVLMEQIEEAPTQMGSGTILIIDDEELIRITASAMLKSMGYTVIFATNGREGVSTFEEIHDQVDLIILDMIMPVMGGKEAFKKLREIDENIPIVISSGFAKVDDMAELKQLNVTGFLHKPFRKKELVELVGKIFG